MRYHLVCYIGTSVAENPVYQIMWYDIAE